MNKIKYIENYDFNQLKNYINKDYNYIILVKSINNDYNTRLFIDNDTKECQINTYLKISSFFKYEENTIKNILENINNTNKLEKVLKKYNIKLYNKYNN